MSEPTDAVTHAQLRAEMVLVESLVTRVDALEVRVTEQEKRPTVKSRAEYMRKYRAKDKPIMISSDTTVRAIATTQMEVERPVTDTPPA